MKGSERAIGEGDLYFVIEEGQANLGDYKKALAMIDAASETGADAIEFQLARAGDLYVKDAPGYGIYKKREFSNPELKNLVTYANGKKLDFIAVPLSHTLIEPLADYGCSSFTVNASDLTNPDIIDTVADSGLPFSLCLPLATEKEIDWAINRIRGKNAKNYVLLHGQHTMASEDGGVAVEHTALGYIEALKKKYQRPVGFIDHTSFSWMPAVAAAAGADVISKHLTLSRKEKGPDWHICLEPEEMKSAVAWAKMIRQSVRTRVKDLAPGENIDRSKMRRSIVALRAISAGEKIARQDICFKRPGTGLDPSEYEVIVGKIAAHKINIDAQIMRADLKEATK